MEVGTDRALFEAVSSGDADAFARLVARYHALVCAVAFGATGNQAISEDVAQDAFVVAWRARAELRDPSRFRSWICAIARHLALNTRRVRQVDPIDDDDTLGAAEIDVHARLERAQRDALVWEALAAMPERYRVPLVLFYREERSAAEVANQLGISTANALQRLARGRRYLKQGIEDSVERTLAASKPQRGRVAAIVTAVGSDIELPSSAGAALEAARASTGSVSWGVTIMKVAMVAGTCAAGIVAMSWGCARWDGESKHGAKTDQAEVDVDDPPPPRPDGTHGGGPDDGPEPGEQLRARASAGHSDGARGDSLGLPAYRLSIVDDQQVAVNLEGGPSEVRGMSEALGIDPPERPVEQMRKVSGRVVDEHGAPVEGAVVITGKRLSMFFGSSLTGRDGDETDARGRFDVDQVAAEPYVLLALHADAGWSVIERVAPGTNAVELEVQLSAPVTVSGQARRGDAPEVGYVVAMDADKRVKLSTGTDPQGRYEMLVPREALTLGFAAGERALGEMLATSPIDARSGKRIEWDPKVSTGTRLAVSAPVPEAHADRTTMVWTYVLPGKVVPKDAADLQKRAKQDESANQRTRGHGGIDLDEIFEYADLPRGSYTICARAEERKVALAMSCTVIEVSGKDEVQEVEIVW
jgi:RNA polymerase sigma factor (sigma-70 family)